MKAAQVNNYGGVDVIEINSEAQKPSLQSGQVLVEVHGASLIPGKISFDIKAGIGLSFLNSILLHHFIIFIISF